MRPACRQAGARNDTGVVLLFLSLSLLFASCSFSWSYEGPKPVPISPVNDWLYRSGQPTEVELNKFKAQGIRTVVNFRDEPDWIRAEKEKVEGLGMKYVSLPWSIMDPADPQLLDRLFKVLDDPGSRPVVMHCKHGRDRTGVMTTLALMHYEKLSREQAREQALETIRPNLRYRMFVDQKLEFFIKKRASLISGSSAPDQKSNKPASEGKVPPVRA